MDEGAVLQALIPPPPGAEASQQRGR